MDAESFWSRFRKAPPHTNSAPYQPTKAMPPVVTPPSLLPEIHAALVERIEFLERDYRALEARVAVTEAGLSLKDSAHGG